MGKLLDIKNLSVSFFTDYGEIRAVRNISFSVGPGEIYGIVGESGSGKSVSMKSVMRLTPDNCKIMSGNILYDGKDLTKLTDKEFQSYRGREMSMIFQDSLTALNPVYTIGSKLAELIRHIEKCSKKEAYSKSLSYLIEVGISDPERCFNSYPHELSGGMRQRIMIAMAIACHPRLIVADEPTTSLDVTIQAQILKLLKNICTKRRMSIILITHDFGAVAQLCSKISVMCGGHIVETGSAENIFLHPAHPYTKTLISSIPSTGRKFEPLLEPPEKKIAHDALCPFLSRCKYSSSECMKQMPNIVETEPGHSVLCYKNNCEGKINE